MVGPNSMVGGAENLENLIIYPPPHIINFGGSMVGNFSFKEKPTHNSPVAIIQSKGVDSFDPHLSTSILTYFGDCQLARINNMVATIVWGFIFLKK